MNLHVGIPFDSESERRKKHRPKTPIKTQWLQSSKSKLLTQAISSKDCDKVKELIRSRSISISKLYRFEEHGHFSPLALVIQFCYRKDLVQSLIKLGADLNSESWFQKDTYQMDGYYYQRHRHISPLYQSLIHRQDSELVKLLIKAGAHVNKYTGKFQNQTDDGVVYTDRKFTCLQHCIKEIEQEDARNEMIKILLEHNADYNLFNDHGSTALHLALWSHQTSSILLLAQYGCNGNNISSSKSSPLAIQMSLGQSDLVPLQILLNAGYDVRQDYKFYEIMESSSSDHYEAINKEVKRWLHEPWSLKLCCRFSIRGCLKNNCQPKVLFSLPIPVPLQHYLNLDDIYKYG